MCLMNNYFREQRKAKINKDKSLKKTKPTQNQTTPTETVQESIPIDEPSADQQYSKRAIVSNADKYQEIVEEKNEQMLAADFSKLLSNPQSIGGHFQFKGEKSWNDGPSGIEKANKLFSNYFNLNLSLLNESVLTLPFYKRIQINENVFTEKEINEMNEKAKLSRAKYDKITSDLKTEEETLEDKVISILTSSDTNKIPDISKKVSLIKFDCEENDLPVQHSSINKYPQKSTIIENLSKHDDTVKNNISIESIGKICNEDVRTKDSKQVQVLDHQSDDELDNLLQMKSSEPVIKNLDHEMAATLVDNLNITESKIQIQSTVKQSETITTQNNEIGNKEDIQKWLDDILND